jgi:hypothetical protein
MLRFTPDSAGPDIGLEQMMPSGYAPSFPDVALVEGWA